MKKFFVAIITALSAFSVVSADNYVGGDISLLPLCEDAGAVYKDHTGKPIADLVPWLKEQGMNAMRVRLFVNPDKYKALHQNDTNSDTRYDPNACQDLEYITPLCRRITDAGLDLMLDFHYSDTWADPAKQWIPIDWEDLNDDELCEKIYLYTKETLLSLKAAGVTPAFIQPGNEISYGMLWGKAGTSSPKKTFMGSGANWQRLGRLLNNAVKACREVCPEAKIVLHTERVAQVDVQKNFYEQMRSLNVNYDIIGLSYYPYFHGDMSVLDRALSSLQTNFPDKNIMIVETGYSYKWAVPGSTYSYESKWPYSDAGQDKFATDLVATLEKYDHVDGLFWWWMEYNAFGTSLSGWYNAPLFDSTTGCATSALTTICSFEGKDSVLPIESAGTNDLNAQWYNLMGQPVNYVTAKTTPGIYVANGKKMIVH